MRTRTFDVNAFSVDSQEISGIPSTMSYSQKRIRISQWPHNWKGILILASLLLLSAAHCSFHCGSNPAHRIKLPIQSEKPAEEVQKAVQEALPEIKGMIQNDLIQAFPGFDIASTSGTWFSASRGSAMINGGNHSYCELIIKLDYDGTSPSPDEVRRVFMESAKRALEQDGWKVVPVNSIGFPVFD